MNRVGILEQTDNRKMSSPNSGNPAVSAGEDPWLSDPPDGGVGFF